MEVELSICLSSGQGSVICNPNADGRSLSYKAPTRLTEASFPITDASFQVDYVHNTTTSTSKVYDTQFGSIASNMMQGSQNSVVYTYGQKALPKRQCLLGSSLVTESLNAESGLIQHVVKNLFALPHGESVLKVHAFILGVNDSVIDLLNVDNESATMIDSIKDGPSIQGLTRQGIKSYKEAVAALKTIAKNVEEEFRDVKDESHENDPFPPYNPSTCIVGILKYANREAAESGTDCNSIHFVAMGDSERPPLCGIHLDQLNKYEKTHKSHSSLVSVFGAIRGNRLRVPFTKSKLTLILRRAYNQEKNNPQNELNKPTKSFILFWAFNDDRHAEETYHVLTTARKISSPMGGTTVGPASRDLTVEKWRLEQDILELKDELSIAKAVHDYKPCIYDQAKPVQNIQEEEFKRITAINKRREEARAKAQAEMRLQAQREAEVIIQKEEKKSNSNLQELEEKLKAKQAHNAGLNAERERKVKEYDKQLDKIRKKKQEEEEKANKLKEEIRAIEEELAARHGAIEKARQQLDMLHQDRTHGRELIMQSRETERENRQKVYNQRKEQREQWIAEIEATNQKVLEQVRAISKEKAAAGIGHFNSSSDDVSEHEVMRDIDAIRKFLPKLVDIDNPRLETPASEKIRLQLEEYFEKEKREFEKKLAEEEQRKKELEKAVEAYKVQLEEYQTRLKKDQLREAVRKERHLDVLVEQVVQYLEHGCQMTKIPSKGVARKRYYYIGEDRKKLCCCELDEIQTVMNKRKPSTIFFFKDIRRIVLGQFTAGFEHYGKGGKRGGDLDDDEGAYNPTNTETLTPQNLSKYFYRSFSIEFRKGKVLDLVTDTDSDFEAWIVAFRRLLGRKEDWEKVFDDKKGSADPQPPIEWGELLEVGGRAGASQLSSEEQRLCSAHHITPKQYLSAKQEVLQKAQSSFITVYDVRTLSSLDLPRAQDVHEYFVAKKLVARTTEQAE
eukprot:GGOE01006844.1.p1 GENE.GGOE01006844.1~~GGOE01006844.1.p1  ORF type:complete len:960 (-),score=290.78 GGOE01006844.1:251-3130(-)